jgi:hypothetical protein
MSEYQYYEFLALDRPLTSKQREELRQLSTRAEITATRFTNEYHWGNFRGDPEKMMADYFDAFLYLANWGTRHLMFRIPRTALDTEYAGQYCCTDAASLIETDDHLIISLYADRDPDDSWDETTGELGGMVAARSELLGGDHRLLYLAWLTGIQWDDVDDEDTEPPVPAGLADLSGALRAVADFLEIDEDLVAVAAVGRGLRLEAAGQASLGGAAPGVDGVFLMQNSLPSGSRMTFTALEDPELHVYCHRDRAGQRADAHGQRLRRDVPGTGPHRHQRGEVGVIHAQLIIHDDEVGQGPVTVGAGDPPELLPVDADHAERLPEFPKVGRAGHGHDQRPARPEDAAGLRGVARPEDAQRQGRRPVREGKGLPDVRAYGRCPRMRSRGAAQRRDRQVQAHAVPVRQGLKDAGQIVAGPGGQVGH